MTPARNPKQCFFVVLEEASGRRHLRRCISEDSARRDALGLTLGGLYQNKKEPTS
jgi:hypothetical protein